MRPTTARSTLLAASLLALLSACGGGGGDGGAGGGSGGGDNRPPPPVQTTVEHRVAGEAIAVGSNVSPIRAGPTFPGESLEELAPKVVLQGTTRS